MKERSIKPGISQRFFSLILDSARLSLGYPGCPPLVSFGPAIWLPRARLCLTRCCAEIPLPDNYVHYTFTPDRLVHPSLTLSRWLWACYLRLSPRTLALQLQLASLSPVLRSLGLYLLSTPTPRPQSPQILQTIPRILNRLTIERMSPEPVPEILSSRKNHGKTTPSNTLSHTPAPVLPPVQVAARSKADSPSMLASLTKSAKQEDKGT